MVIANEDLQNYEIPIIAAPPPQVFDMIDYCQPRAPSVLSTDEYPGPNNFEVFIIPNGTKNPWEFSPTLNKIFINMQEPFPVDFSIRNRPIDKKFYIRVTPAYSLPQHSQEIVVRCINHEHPRDPSNQDIDSHIRQHVIRCDNRDAWYLGDKEKDERLNILIPLAVPQAGSDSVREFFRFACKTSCPAGMNRRPIQVIFTLENERLEILGRRILHVRICCCPKRDKDKEEKDCESNKESTSRGKKRKLNKTDKKLLPSSETTVDTKEYTINVKVLGKDNYKAVLEFCRDRMSGRSLSENENDKNCPFKKCAKSINDLLNNQD